MKSNSTVFIVLTIGLLIIVELLLYGSSESKNITAIDSQLVAINMSVEKMRVEKNSLQSDINRMNSAIATVPDTIPASIFTGFKDHEKLFTEFIDYLQSSSFDGIDTEFSLPNKQEFQKDPVPLHQVEIDFILQFKELNEAEAFFRQILQQVKKYPVTVNNLNITRGGDAKSSKTDSITASLKVTFLVPTKLKEQVLSLVKGGQV